MQVFLSHATEDLDIAESIGSWLHGRGIQVWLDKWRLTAGDSLVEKIGDGIESSDRLVVLLSAHSVDSNWVKREVASGLVMELAEEKGFGEKFVIPALLTPCKVPVLLRDKLYANYTNKQFEAACEELLRGILDTPIGPQQTSFDNRIVRIHNVPSRGDGKYAIMVEFAVRMSPTIGANVGADAGVAYTAAGGGFAPPNSPHLVQFGGVYTNSFERNEPPIYARKFDSPNITASRSYYFYFEANDPISPKAVQFLDFYDREP